MHALAKATRVSHELFMKIERNKKAKLAYDAKMDAEREGLEKQYKLAQEDVANQMMLKEMWMGRANEWKASKGLPITSPALPKSPQTQNNPPSLEQRNVVTPINNPYTKPTANYASKPPPAPVQPAGGSSPVFDASKYEEESKLNAPPTSVQEKQKEEHEGVAQDLNEFFDNHNKEDEEAMLMATMNSSEQAEYVWNTYGRHAERAYMMNTYGIDTEKSLTNGHSNGKEWENEEAELEAYEEAQNATAEHDRKTAFASQDPTKSTVAAEVTTAGRKRTRKPSLKVKEMEDAASQGVVIKKEKIELQNLV